MNPNIEGEGRRKPARLQQQKGREQKKGWEARRTWRKDGRVEENGQEEGLLEFKKNMKNSRLFSDRLIPQRAA